MIFALPLATYGPRRTFLLNMTTMPQPGSSSLSPLSRLLESSLPDKLKMGEYHNLLTQSLLATNHVQDCAIIEQKNLSVMTASIGFKNERGLILVKTGMYIICATYTKGMYPSVCVEAVEKLGDYFKTKGK
ncbi:profilin-4 isoform X3 [Mobula birostris]|uniref:profilin-4 isoform X3 n=1 Tax=Mobula birostris TaxID=1983395 RepID=UPI003B28502F